MKDKRGENGKEGRHQQKERDRKSDRKKERNSQVKGVASDARLREKKKERQQRRDTRRRSCLPFGMNRELVRIQKKKKSLAKREQETTDDKARCCWCWGGEASRLPESTENSRVELRKKSRRLSSKTNEMHADFCELLSTHENQPRRLMPED